MQCSRLGDAMAQDGEVRGGGGPILRDTRVEAHPA